MRMCIPELGTRLVLSEDWDLVVHDEKRNQTVYDTLAETQGVELSFVGTSTWRSWDGQALALTLPQGTVLTVDRIYIRKGQSDFSSVTFVIEETTHPFLGGRCAKPTWDGRDFRRVKRRFWARLEDVNRMEVEDVQ